MIKNGDKVRTKYDSKLYINGNPMGVTIPAGYKGVVYYVIQDSNDVLVNWTDLKYASYMPALIPKYELELDEISSTDKNDNASLWDDANET